MGQGQLAGLQPFLQSGFGVLGGRLDLGAQLGAFEEGKDDLTHHLKPSIQVDRTQHRLEGIGQDGGAVFAAGLALALTQADDAGDAQRHRAFVQGRLLDQMRPCTRQLALGQGLHGAVEAF